MPQSHHINVIEHVWDMLKRNVALANATNLDMLWDTIQREWNAIPNATIAKLYDSMPRRVSMVAQAKGGNVRY